MEIMKRIVIIAICLLATVVLQPLNGNADIEIVI